MIIFQYIICVVVIYILIRLIKFVIYQYKLYQQCKHLPGPEIRLPLIGNLDIFWEIVGNDKAVSKRFVQKLTELCDTYGQETGFIRLFLGPFIPWIVVCDAKLGKKVLASPAHQSKATYYRIIKSCATNSLVACSAVKSRHDRKILKEFFTYSYLNMYLTKMESHLTKVVTRIDDCIEKEDGYYRNVDHLVSSFVYDAVGDNLFSSKFNTLQTGVEPDNVAAMQDMFELLTLAMFQPWRYLPSNRFFVLFLNVFYLIFTGNLHGLKACFTFHFKLLDIIKERYKQWKQIIRREKVAINGMSCFTGSSFIDTLLLGVFTEPSKLLKLDSFQDVIWHMNLFIVVGHDTSAALISWMLYMLAHYPEAQEKAREEIDEFLAELELHKETPTQLNLKRLSYLDCCIKEAVRLYPVGPLLGRFARQPLSVTDQLAIPANVNVAVFNAYAHRQEKYYPNAKQYIPERFQQKDSDADTPNQVFFGFSLGERSCLGKQYAVNQIKLFFLTLLSRYTITAVDKLGDIAELHYFVERSQNYSVKIRKRQL